MNAESSFRLVTSCAKALFGFVARGAASCCLVALVVAQNTTVPAIMNGVEGGGASSVPFGSNFACRYQCIYDVDELPWVGPYVITGINLRPDLAGGGMVPAKGFIEVSVLMSTCPKTSTDVGAEFADNYGTDATWVIQNRIMQLPAQPALPPMATGPRPANIRFPFDVPWAYGLTPVTSTLPAPDSLLIEIWIHAQPSGLYLVDNLGSCVAPTGSFGMVGPACSVPVSPPNQPVPIALTGDQSMQAGSLYTWRIENAMPGMPFLVAVDLTDQGNLVGNPSWPLPHPMFDPGNPSLPYPPLNQPAPDCWLNVNVATSLGGICDQSGRGQAAGLLPPGRELVGVTFFAQAIVLAPTANALRFITSQGYSATVCGPLGATRIHAFYNNNASPPQMLPANGAVQRGQGLVFEVF